MKFKYIGLTPIKDIDLAIEGITSPNESIVPNQIIDIPDEKTLLIQRISVGGVYEPYTEPKKVGRPKKQNKKEDKEE